MRKWNNLFTIQEGEQHTDKNLRRVLISSVSSILVCIICLLSATWAWFTVSVESDFAINIIKQELQVVICPELSEEEDIDIRITSVEGSVQASDAADVSDGDASEISDGDASEISDGDAWDISDAGVGAVVALSYNKYRLSGPGTYGITMTFKDDENNNSTGFVVMNAAGILSDGSNVNWTYYVELATNADRAYWYCLNVNEDVTTVDVNFYVDWTVPDNAQKFGK